MRLRIYIDVSYLQWCQSNQHRTLGCPTMLLAFLHDRSAVSSWLLPLWSSSEGILPHSPQSDRETCGTLGLTALEIKHRVAKVLRPASCHVLTWLSTLCRARLAETWKKKDTNIMHRINHQHISANLQASENFQRQSSTQHTWKLPRNSRSNAVFSIFDLLANRWRIKLRPWMVDARDLTLFNWEASALMVAAWPCWQMSIGAPQAHMFSSDFMDAHMSSKRAHASLVSGFDKLNPPELLRIPGVGVDIDPFRLGSNCGSNCRCHLRMQTAKHCRTNLNVLGCPRRPCSAGMGFERLGHAPQCFLRAPCLWNLQDRAHGSAAHELYHVLAVYFSSTAVFASSAAPEFGSTIFIKLTKVSFISCAQEESVAKVVDLAKKLPPCTWSGSGKKRPPAASLKKAWPLRSRPYSRRCKPFTIWPHTPTTSCAFSNKEESPRPKRDNLHGILSEVWSFMRSQKTCKELEIWLKPCAVAFFANSGNCASQLANSCPSPPLHFITAMREDANWAWRSAAEVRPQLKQIKLKKTFWHRNVIVIAPIERYAQKTAFIIRKSCLLKLCVS